MGLLQIFITGILCAERPAILPVCRVEFPTRGHHVVRAGLWAVVPASSTYRSRTSDVPDISVTFRCRTAWITLCVVMMKYGNELYNVLPRSSGAGCCRVC